ncbi:hypothetical protein GCM10007916_10570 [Psychromonas marina]|uniref:Alginate lyase 2 domain-containing protein n=1 Tax=Psychromonas marina TaxID=88364 RepID=A0ABQ6DYD0_9GAMM|nr:polysaccharide lyase family 7 protein [Psychromonas marina]GLS89990.1 hypothetical protein GCM10007916_10570 [Psychromonas marina]
MKLKHLKYSTIALAFLTVGCTTTSDAHKGDIASEQVAPAQYAQFSPILAASKLQISVPNAKPGSKEEVAVDSNFTGIVNDNFYVDKSSEAFVFKMEGYKLRNELRIMENFKTNDPNTIHRLSAELLLVDPYNSIKDSPKKRNEMTVLQVHNKGTVDDGKHGVGYIPHPLLRVVWLGDRNGIKNHYWAVIKTNDLNCKKMDGKVLDPECKNSYAKIDLGAASPTEATSFDISVGAEKLVIDVNGETKVDHSLDYWTHMLSYFKAGVYNQFENGQSEAHFNKLEYVVENK